jgi:hypothetical protein
MQLDIDGNLHPISRPLHVSRIFYETTEVLNLEKGFIRAVIVDTSKNGSLTDSVYVIIKATKIRLTRAVTNDYNGNGYLDEIMHFSRPVDLPSSII